MDAAWEGALSSIAALSIGGVSAILGLWVDRDPRRPAYFAGAMSGLIGIAVAVGIAQSVLDAQEAIDKEADLDRMIESVSEIAVATGDKELGKLIEEQLGTKLEIPDPPAEEPAAEAELAAADGTVAPAGTAAPEGTAAAEGTATPEGAAAPAAQE